MALKDAYRRQQRAARPAGGLANLFPQQEGFVPTEPGDPNFGLSTTPSSQAQFPAAAAEQRLYQNRTQAKNVLEQAEAAGINTLLPQYAPIQQIAEKGFKERALSIGEGLINFIDGGREAVNLLFQDVIGGVAEEGYRDPTLSDYFDALWFGIKDQEGFTEATGLNPDSGSHTLDLLGWEPSDTLPGKIARGIGTFGFEMLTDPLTYVTFGLSGLGKGAAMAAGRRFGDDVVAGIMPHVRDGSLGVAIDKMSSKYMRNLARNVDGITDDFIAKHLANLDPDRQQAVWRWLVKNGHPDLDPNDSWAIIAAARENATELAIYNKVRDDVLAPLLRRDFKAINKEALEDLPAYAYGGARISIPFTERALRQGIIIPGTQGLGKQLVGDPIRAMSAQLKKLTPYRKLARKLDDIADNVWADRSLMHGLAKAEGGVEGWQYHIVETAIDRLRNRHTLEVTKAQLNSRKERIVELARTAKPATMDEDEWLDKVWGDVMSRLENRGATETLTANLFQPGTMGRLDLQGDLDREVQALADNLRETFDGLHTALAVFDKEAAEKYIKGYAPHQVNTEVSALLGELAAKGGTQTREAIMAAQARGDMGGVLMAQLLNAIGKGGRLEDALGATRYTNHRDVGRIEALTLTDLGTVLFDQNFLRGLKNSASRVGTEAGEVIDDALSTQYLTVRELNAAIKPVLEELAGKYGVPLPKNWDGRVFNDNPLDVASAYIENLDEVIAQWGYVDALHSAGLAVRHGSAPDTQSMLQSLYANWLKQSRAIREKHPLKPQKGDRLVPTSFLEQMVDPVDWSKAEARASGMGAEELRDMFDLEMGEEFPILRGTQIDKDTLKVTEPAVKAESWDDFVDNIRENGIEKPIVVGVDLDGYAIIVDGHNRLRAAIDAGIEDVPIEWRPMNDLDEVAFEHGVDLKPHLRDEWIPQTPDPVRSKTAIPEIKLTPEQDQLARKMRNGIGRTSEQSAANKEKMRKYYDQVGRHGLTSKEWDEARALSRWWYQNRQRIGKRAYRALTPEEADEMLLAWRAGANLQRAGRVDIPFANVDLTGDFARSARKGASGEGGWVAQFSPDTQAAWNDLNVAMEIGKTGKMEDEWFVSGQFVVKRVDDEKKIIYLEPRDQDKLPGLTGREKTPMKQTINRPPTAPGLPTMYHGARTATLTERLESLEVGLTRGDAASGNMLGPGFYATTSPRVANTKGYGGGKGGSVNRLEWTGEGTPRELDLEAAPEPDALDAIQEWAQSLPQTAPKTLQRVREDGRNYYFDGDDELLAEVWEDPSGLAHIAVTVEGDYMLQLPKDLFDPDQIFTSAVEAEKHLKAAWKELWRNNMSPVIEEFNQYLDHVRRAVQTGDTSVDVTMEDVWQQARRTAERVGDNLDEDVARLNIALRDKGYDVMRYDGGVRMGTERHDAYVWLRPENLRLVDEPSIKTFSEEANRRTAAELGFKNVEELEDWRLAGGVTDQVPSGGGTRSFETADILKTSPWAHEVTERRVLRGFEGAASKAVANTPGIESDVALRKQGFRNVEEARSVIRTIASEDSHDRIVAREVLRDANGRVTGVSAEPDIFVNDKFGLRRYNQVDEFTPAELKDGARQTVKLANGSRIVSKVRAGVSETRIIVDKDHRIIGVSGRSVDTTEAHDTIVKDLVDLMDEAVIDQKWVDDFMYGPVRTNYEHQDGILLWEAMLHRINNLPDAAIEAMTNLPAEYVGFHRQYEAWVGEFNQFFKDYASVYSDETGELFLTTTELAGSQNFIDRYKNLKKAAGEMKDEYGLKAIEDVFKGVSEFMGLADRPGFVNPRMFALGGPALEKSVVQNDMLKFTRQLARNAATIYTPEGVAALKLSTNAVLTWWKAMATIARPGFHIRNLIGGVWNNMIAGVGPADYLAVKTHAIAIRKKVLSDRLNFDDAIRAVIKDPKEQATWIAAWENDVLSGFVSTEFRNLTGAQKKGRMAWANIFDIEQFGLTRMGGRFMESIEDFLRMSTFHAWYDPDNPATAKVARDMVKAVHFDYSNLTPFETRVKSFVPFFVWTKNNLALQTRQFAENPRMVQRYRAMMNSMDDQFEDSGYPTPENYSAFAFDTGYKVNGGTPFWARVMIDPDLPIRDFLELPRPSPPELANYANELLGPHIGGLIDLNAQRDLGPVNAPAPINSVLKALAAVGLFDTTMDGDVRIPYWSRTMMELAMPFGRDVVEPAFGGPTDPNRQARAGIGEDAGALESIGKAFAAPLSRAVGVQYSPPSDVRAAAGGSNQAMDALIEQLRLSGQLPPAPQQGGGGGLDLSGLIPGG